MTERKEDEKVNILNSETVLFFSLSLTPSIYFLLSHFLIRSVHGFELEEKDECEQPAESE